MISLSRHFMLNKHSPCSRNLVDGHVKQATVTASCQTHVSQVDGQGGGGAVGLTVGTLVGDNVGFRVGAKVGDSVGVIVGYTVGMLVGDNVGDTVGVEVGDSVGALVGAKVGAKVAPYSHTYGKDPHEVTLVVTDRVRPPDAPTPKHLPWPMVAHPMLLKNDTSTGSSLSHCKPSKFMFNVVSASGKCSPTQNDEVTEFAAASAVSALRSPTFCMVARCDIVYPEYESAQTSLASSQSAAVWCKT